MSFRPLWNSSSNDENRCTLILPSSGVANTFVYNGDGLRYQKQDSLGTTRFVWDGQAYLSETNSSGVTQAPNHRHPHFFG